ncbi:MAG TPA: TonB C-terminal domain-containing protein [Verrucomicrobiota bacterium]|nr:TonB C-terminal domain-containing protein [Verrucomicrobiota bacterium]
MLVLGPMLLAKREEKVRVIDLVPSTVIDQLLAPAAPAEPAPAPPAPKKVPPKPKPKPVPTKPKPKKNTPKPKPKPKIKVNLNSNVRRSDTQKIKAQKEAAERARRAEARQQAAINKLETNLSGRTSVNVPVGRYASANYESFIRRKYMDATIHPGAVSGDPVVKVRLVIARSGRVISASVMGFSGAGSWDRAVQKALDRVKFIKPFPNSMKGGQQTFNLNFNSKNFS